MKVFARPVLIATVLGMLALPVHAAAAQPSPAPQYTMIDLGTLGGPSNYINNPGMVLNNRGMAAPFGADINALDPHPDACFNPDCYRSHAAVWQAGHLVDLGAFPGQTSSGVQGMSPNGQFAAGVSSDGMIDPVSNIPVMRAAFFTEGRVLDLGTLGGTFSGAADVNDRGQVVGAAENGVPDRYAGSLGGAFNQPDMPSSGTVQIRAFLWQGGSMRDLGTLGGNDAEAWRINARGQVTGASFTTTTANATTGAPTQHPFLWDRGRMLDLGTLGGTWGLPADLNDAGQVVGSMNLAGDQAHHGFLWKDGKLTDLGTLGGATSDAEWENAAGDVVGRADVPNTGPACDPGGVLGSNKCPHHAVMWKNGTLIDLGTPAGQACATATGINAQDQVVGSTGSCGHGGDGFLWQDGSMYLASAIVPPLPSGLRIVDFLYINDRGEIYGAGRLPNGEDRAVLLEPAHRTMAVQGSTVPEGNGASASFTVWFDSAAPGQGYVLFGPGAGCSGLIYTASNDLDAGSTRHTVVVTGDEMNLSAGGLLPGQTYWYEVVTLTRNGVEIDNNGGKCYSVTVPTL